MFYCEFWKFFRTAVVLNTFERLPLGFNSCWSAILFSLEIFLQNISLQLFFQNTVGGLPFRSSDRRCSVRKGVLRNFAKFTGKHLCQSLCFKKLYATLLKKRLWHRCFPMCFFTEHLRKAASVPLNIETLLKSHFGTVVLL